MENRKLNEQPENMTIICNIQMMEKFIYQDRGHTFKELENMTYGGLMALQNETIPHYNATIQLKQF